jgi:hypothetical protein
MADASGTSSEGGQLTDATVGSPDANGGDDLGSDATTASDGSPGASEDANAADATGSDAEPSDDGAADAGGLDAAVSDGGTFACGTQHCMLGAEYCLVTRQFLPAIGALPPIVIFDGGTGTTLRYQCQKLVSCDSADECSCIDPTMLCSCTTVGDHIVDNCAVSIIPLPVSAAH